MLRFYILVVIAVGSDTGANGSDASQECNTDLASLFKVWFQRTTENCRIGRHCVATAFLMSSESYRACPYTAQPTY